MDTVNLIFPHQLFKRSPLQEYDGFFYIVEEFLFFQQYNFHKQKIAFHRASMKAYATHLQHQGKHVFYIDAQQKKSDVRRLISWLHNQGVEQINYIDPTDDWLEKRLKAGASKFGLKLNRHESPLFLNSRLDNKSFFKSSKKKFFQTSFYKSQRLKLKILISESGDPIGGKWSFDVENRKRYPSGKKAPILVRPQPNEYYDEARRYVSRNFGNNIGEIGMQCLYPYDFVTAEAWLKDFLNHRFQEFGPYEDAIVTKEDILNHSVLSPMLNTGLLTPQYVLRETLAYAREHDVPINSTEGFVRQIIGWREFIRGIYDCKGVEERRRNFWEFSRKIPDSFYTGETQIEPVDRTIRKILQTGYCHHIERLMVLGNFMMLCEFDPDHVYRWFMELFIDAYDWVMVPNVYGMSQFADGGLMSTKPYISGSNYLVKMGDFEKGEWQDIWDALFWRFMNVHRHFFLKNPRLGMLVRTFDKMSLEKQRYLISIAERYLSQLN